MDRASFGKYLFQAFRVIALESGDLSGLNDSLLIKAVTANENLKAYGFCLLPSDIAKLAVSKDLDGVCKTVEQYVDSIDAKPMYPDFPSQVMAMDAAQYRLHQCAHYFSTYGMESIFGVKVSRGWLPDVEDTDKTVSDERLLASKCLKVIDSGSEYAYVLTHVLGRSERMSEHDREAVRYIFENELERVSFETLSVPFKQNLLDLFRISFDTMPADEFEAAMHCVCKHTGDVWKAVDYLLSRHKYHFKTSQKKRIVRLLESYPVSDFAENLILSGKKGERVIKVAEYLSFNAFSKKADYAECLRLLRAGELRSWYSKYEKLRLEKNPKLLEFTVARPGEALRRLRVLTAIFGSAAVDKALVPVADRLSASTIMGVLRALADEEKDVEVVRILEHLLFTKLSQADTELRDKKVFLDAADADLTKSFYTGNRRGYITGYYPAGIALKIPEDAKHIRFFVYWNDKDRVDMDLHAYAKDADGGVVHIGWNADFKDKGIATSGDITHSDAAEYIDIDLDSHEIDRVHLVIDTFYAGENNYFTEVETCFAGLMAVKNLGTEVKLYNPDNCFYSHDLTKADIKQLRYGWVDIKNRLLMLLGEKDMTGNTDPVTEEYPLNFSLDTYFNKILFPPQNAVPVSNPADADVVISFGKKENALDILEHNFWLDV